MNPRLLYPALLLVLGSPLSSTGWDDPGCDVNELDSDILAFIFRRHCSWKPPASLWESLELHRDNPVPILSNASRHHCQGTSLPLASAQLWVQHADIVIRLGADRTSLYTQLHRECNNRTSPTACLVFVEVEAVWCNDIGASLLLEAIQLPFVLLTASTEPSCVPACSECGGGGKGAAAGGGIERRRAHEFVESLLRSPLVIRWYATDGCLHGLHPSHSLDKLVPLPRGPRGWDGGGGGGRSAMMQLGQLDPRALFEGGQKHKRLCVLQGKGQGGNGEGVGRGLGGVGGPPIPSTQPPGDDELEGDDHSQTESQAFSVDEGCASDDPAHRALALSRSLFAISLPDQPAGKAAEEDREVLADRAASGCGYGGADPHWAWEALAVGTVPIVLSEWAPPVYSRLPVVTLSHLAELAEMTNEALEGWRRHLLAMRSQFHWTRATAFWW